MINSYSKILDVMQGNPLRWLLMAKCLEDKLGSSDITTIQKADDTNLADVVDKYEIELTNALKEQYNGLSDSTPEDKLEYQISEAFVDCYKEREDYTIYDERNLRFLATRTCDKIKAASLLKKYVGRSYFDDNEFVRIEQLPGDLIVRIGREGSPVLYITVEDKENDLFCAEAENIGIQEFDCHEIIQFAGKTFITYRLWYD